MTDDPHSLVEAPPASARAPWEIQEIAAGALVLVVGVVAVSGVAAGILGGTGATEGSSGVQTAAQTLLQATQWAGAFTAFLLVCALGLTWWQVQGWSDALDDIGNEDRNEDNSPTGADEARRHIVRNRALTRWAVLGLVICSLAAVGMLVGVVLQTSPPESSLKWQEWLSTGGAALATLILAGVGVLAVIRVWRLGDLALYSPGSIPTP